VNLTGAPKYVGGEVLAPYTLVVREQFSSPGGWGSVKTSKRRRTLPLARPLIEALQTLHERASAAGPVSPDAPVFTVKDGRPLNAGAALRTWLKPAGAAIGVPSLSWHDLRRTFATLTDVAGLTAAQRQALLGHATARMTAHYTMADVEHTRAALDLMAGRLMPHEPLRCAVCGALDCAVHAAAASSL
jgi:integrase